MKTLNLIYKLLVLIVVLASCEGKEVDIDKMIKNKNNPIKYVIEGQISNLVKKQHVFISKPGMISGSKNYEGVHNAKVTISDGELEWDFKELSVESKKYQDLYLSGAPYLADGGVYESEKYFAGKPNVTYTLKVVINGEEFTAKETMPKNEAMDDKEFVSLQQSTEFTNYIFGADRNAIWTSSTSDRVSNSILNKENLKIIVQGRINSFTKHHTVSFDSNDSQNHILKSNYEEQQFNILRRYSVTNGYSDYIWSYTFGQGESVFSIEQNTHPSNFNNKKIAGYFSTINCSQYQVNENTYVPEFISYFGETKIYTANYSDKGSFRLTANTDGSCKLEGLNEIIIGAYDITDNKQMRVYFPRKYAKPYKGLYDFYEVKLKKGLPFKQEHPEDVITYWSRENAFFQIQTNGSIKSQDGMVWNIE